MDQERDTKVLEETFALVERDVRRGFEGALAPREPAFARELHDAGDDINARGPYAATEQLVAVPWVYRCVHVGEFLGVPPTYVELELRGATFVHAGSGDAESWDYYRYIDYLGALHQLGVTTTSRPGLTPEEFENWRTNR